ncbi:MAG: DUF5060 domain-containing protein [Balneolaceae bacterium]|nr:DUF5060 domain-containing protein [Balneolaceae bacterium]
MHPADVFGQPNSSEVHVWEMVEISFEGEDEYENNYTDVRMWVDLEGPDFSRRIYGFWDGGNTYKVRLVATKPGKWSWKSGSNQPGDEGLNGYSGSFYAQEWTVEEKAQNPNRHGFVRATPDGHALQYADGTPFFLTGDTWLAGATWRLPFRGAAPPENYKPAPGIGFEDAVHYRKRQGYNSVSMIASFPNWDADIDPSTYADSNGIYVRNAWEKFGYDVSGAKGVDASGGSSYWGTFTAKNMRDEYGNLPFEMSEEHEGVSNFNRINPEYFQSLDQKMLYLHKQGLVPLLETVRHDVGPSWNAYFDFNETFARYVQYLISRYGAHNMIFSGIHLDWIPDEYSLTAEQFNQALTYHLKEYGPLPFGQPHTTLINNSTYLQFGHGDSVPWLTMHSVGNNPRHHGVYEMQETIFKLNPAYPTINFELYYTGWDHNLTTIAGERPPVNSARDNYFARAQMYGSVLSGGLTGHVHGTASYDITTTGEPDGARPHIWEAMKYESGSYMQHLKAFMLSEGERYKDLRLATDDITPRKAEGSPPEGLDGWSFMMRTPDKNFALLYFENGATLPTLSGFNPGTEYFFQWYNPKNGTWKQPVTIQSNKEGELELPAFPESSDRPNTDWAAKIVIQK